MPRPAETSLDRRIVVAVLVVILLGAAGLLLSSLRDERRLASANELVRTAPAEALRDATAANGPATRTRATGVVVSALVGLGDLDGAESVARADVRAHPDDPFSVRRLYQVQVLRSREFAARRTLRTLRTIDPKFADGTGG